MIHCSIRLFLLLLGLFICVPQAHADRDPNIQKVRNCRCPTGSTEKCTKGNKDTEELSGTGNSWGDCRCYNGDTVVPFLPSLRVNFRWEPANYIYYEIPPNNLMNAKMPTNLAKTQFIEPDKFKNYIERSFGQWEQDCCGSNKPSIHTIRVDSQDGIYQRPIIADTDVDDNGNIKENVIKDIRNKIWVAYESKEDCKGKTNCSGVDLNYGVLAVTPITYNGNRRIIRARTVFNAMDYVWRIDSENLGCNKNDTKTGTNGNSFPNCYDFPSVAVHELGHFLGIQHSACSDSIMYGTADTTTVKTEIKQGDRESMCGINSSCNNSGYPSGYCSDETKYKRQSDKAEMILDSAGACTQTRVDSDANATQIQAGCAQRFEACRTQADCRKINNGTGTMDCVSKRPFYWPKEDKIEQTLGFCNFTCKVNSDCPFGESCGPGKYCIIDNSLSDPEQNQCLANQDEPTPADKMTDLCKKCEDETDCLSGVCLAVSNSESATTGFCSGLCAGPSSEACTKNNGVCKAIKDGVITHYVCYPKDESCMNESGTYRKLNEACDDQNRCEAGLTCYPMITGKACLESCDPSAQSNACRSPGDTCFVDPKTKIAVCGKADMQEGENCAPPNVSFCGKDRKKLCGHPEGTDSATNSKCYIRCDGEYGNTCASDQKCVSGVCDPIKPPACMEDLGSTCTENIQCESGFCKSLENQKLCSAGCTVSTNMGCPNGFTCKKQDNNSNTGFCWPNSGNATPGRCNTHGCGHCNNTHLGYFEYLVALAIVGRFFVRLLKFRKST